MERVLPNLGAGTLSRWLQDAHTVDGIVKGLKAEGWPTDAWQALQQFAMRVAQGCAAR
jgi:DNA polymerase-3 subunit delta